MDAALLVVALTLGQVRFIPTLEQPEVILDYAVDAVEITDVVEESYERLDWFDRESTWVYAPNYVSTYIVLWRKGIEGRIFSDGCYVFRQARFLLQLDESGGGGVLTMWGLTTYDSDRHESVTYGVRIRFRGLFRTRRHRHPLFDVPQQQRWRLPVPR